MTVNPASRGPALALLASVICGPAVLVHGGDWSDRVENNITIDGEHWGIGGRAYLNHDTDHYILEPHWEYDVGGSDAYFKFAQHFVGFDYKLHQNVSVGPFLEIDTDSGWDRELMFLGLQVALKIKN